VVSLVAQPDAPQPGKLLLTADSDGPFLLRVDRGERRHDLRVKLGRNSFVLE
jgi:hypothetical protein